MTMMTRTNAIISVSCTSWTEFTMRLGAIESGDQVDRARQLEAELRQQTRESIVATSTALAPA